MVSDFWAAYNAVVCALRQMCMVHLLRELEHTEKYKSPSKHWPAFAKKLRRLLGDAIRLWRRRDELSEEAYAWRRNRLEVRLQQLIETPWEGTHAKRLVKRLRRHRNDLFTFLDQPGVPFDNNAGERAIRPAVIIRKNSYGNPSQRGADCLPRAALADSWVQVDRRIDPWLSGLSKPVAPAVVGPACLLHPDVANGKMFPQ